jgi:hypothetical protein
MTSKDKKSPPPLAHSWDLPSESSVPTPVDDIVASSPPPAPAPPPVTPTFAALATAREMERTYALTGYPVHAECMREFCRKLEGG